uniref:ABC transporter substrate-binding protein n=1 Tax=Aminobacter niigataensis TaxID=83265 RepID=UPI0028528C03|nr:ABC transporter substrate-binding protein [Aminobacter niigataensis]WMD00119.1 ABC transporter substrate-binding protein [Aminobacter niigataensis]
MTFNRRSVLKSAAVGAGSLVFLPHLLGRAQAQGGTLTVSLPNNPSTLDPFYQANHDALVISQSIFENLIAVDTDGNLVPQLAAAMPEVSEDQLEYTFKLREGVKFHNGKVLDAEDVKYSFDWVLNPENKALRRPLFYRIAEVTVVDPLKVKFRLSEPFRPWLYYMMKYMGIVPKGSREELGADKFKSAPVGVGTGPAKFVEWRQNDRVVLERNADYWEEGAPKWDKLVVRVIPDESSRLAYLLTGQLDVISSPSPKDYVNLQKNPDVVVGAKQTLGGWFFLMTNNQTAPFDDINVRRAISSAIDRKMIADHIYYGLVAPASIPAPPGSWWFDEDADAVNAYDPAKAKTLVQQSKYAGKCEFDMLVPSHPYLVDVRDAAVIIQAQLAEIGVKVNIQELEQGVLLQQTRNGTYTAALQVWMSPGEPTYMIDLIYGKDNVFSKSVGWTNERAWDLIGQTYRHSDEATLKPIFTELLGELADQAPHVWLGFVSATNAWRKDVQNFKVNQGLTMRVKDVSNS